MCVGVRFVCLPIGTDQWLNGTELTNIFWFSIHFWKGAIRLKRAIPRQNACGVLSAGRPSGRLALRHRLARVFPRASHENRVRMQPGNLTALGVWPGRPHARPAQSGRARIA